MSLPSRPTSSTNTPKHQLFQGYPYQRQLDKQDQLLDNASYAYIAGTYVSGLCW